MQNIDKINRSIANASASLGNYPESNAVNKSMLHRDIQSVISDRSNIKVDCHDGVVTISGRFANQQDKNNALRKAICNPAACKVINNAN